MRLTQVREQRVEGSTSPRGDGANKYWDLPVSLPQAAGGLLFTLSAVASFVAPMFMALAHERYAAPFNQYWLASALLGAGFPLIGYLLLARKHATRLAWLFLLLGLFMAVGQLLSAFGVYVRLVEGSRTLGPLAPLVGVGNLMADTGFAMFPLIFLFFPDGQLPSARWRWLVRFWVLAVAQHWLLLASEAAFGALVPAWCLEIAPVTLERPLRLWWQPQLPLVVGLVAGSVLSLADRFRKATPDERQQIKWPLYAALLAPIGLWLNEVFPTRAWLIGGVNIALILVAIGVAVLRYRLWDIDVVINRTLVYGALTACVVGLYVLIVGYLGTLFRTGGGQPQGLPLQLVAAGVVAVLFAPLRDRLQRGVNRLMYGERDDPYAVLTRLGERLEGTLAPEAVVSTIVETVRDSLRLSFAAIALERDGTQEIVAASGTPLEGALYIPLTYQNELMGALLLAPRVGERDFSPADRRLLDDLARQAGVAVHAVRLTTDLQRLNVELQRSRERLVATREEECRRIRRDLHDGIGPTLASLVQRLDAARMLVTTEPESTVELLTDLKSQIRQSIADIRHLVYALRPPVLDEFGLLSAIREHAFSFNQASGPRCAWTRRTVCRRCPPPSRWPPTASCRRR